MALPCQLMPAGLWPLPCAFLGLLLLPAQAPIYGFTTSSCLTSWADNSTQPGPGREAFQRVPMGVGRGAEGHGGGEWGLWTAWLRHNQHEVD